MKQVSLYGGARAPAWYSGRRGWKAALLAVSSLLLPLSHASAADDATPIKIGMVLAKQGPFSELGTLQAGGAQLAVEQAGGKVLGRPIQVIWSDEPDPQNATQNFAKLAEDDKVVGILGGTGSATALAMSSTAKREKLPFIVTGAAAREITGKACNRYTFRTMVTLPALAAATVPPSLKLGKEWYFVVANYAYGQDLHDTFKAALLKAGGTEVGADFVPAGTSDFSSYLLKIRQAQPKLIVTGLGGTDNTRFIKQYTEYGLRNKIPLMIPAISDTHMWGVGPELATGMHANLWHYSDPANSDAEKAMTKAWRATHDKPPTVEVWQGWASMRMLLSAIESTHSTDPKAIVQALETLKVPNGKTPLYYRSWDHQMIHPMLLLRGEAPPANDKWDMLKVLAHVPDNAADTDRAYGTPAEVGCTLGDF
ncbi:MAG: ABC transporter substrate-binding protein [Janthinobacterium lividum]